MQKQEFKVVGKGNKERIVYIHDNALRWMEKYFILANEKENLTFSELENKPLFVTSKNLMIDLLLLAYSIFLNKLVNGQVLIMFILIASEELLQQIY